MTIHVIKGCVDRGRTSPSGVAVALGSGIDGSLRLTGGTTGWGDARFAGDVASASRFALGDLPCFGLLTPDILRGG